MTALSAALALRPTVLRFLEDEYDDTSATVIPYIQSIMSIYKKEKKRNAQGHLTEEKASFLTRLLETTISKMRFSSEEEWGADEDDEDGEDEAVIAFAEMRKVRPVLRRSSTTCCRLSLMICPASSSLSQSEPENALRCSRLDRF